MIDFKDLLTRLSNADVAAFLQLKFTEKGGEVRMPCPYCNTGGDRILLINPDNSYRCWRCEKKGDVIGLTAFVKGIGVRQAGEMLAAHFNVGKEYKGRNGQAPAPAPVPAATPAQAALKGTEKKNGGMAPIAHLDPKHELVQKVGFKSEDAEKLGVGYAAKGILKGTVGVPIRDSSGTLTGYLGITEAKHPKEWKLS